ncbi:MAG: amidohydrolase [Acidimicrobiia bacterium]
MTSHRRLLIGEAVRTARGIHGNAVLMHDDRVVAVGDQRTLRQPGVRIENYEGAFLLPGMRDAHMHPVPYAASLFGISLEEVTSISMLQETIRTASADLAPNAPFVALRLDDASLAERRLPTRDDLDAAAPDRPVLVHRYCGHVAIANTAALRMAGITPSTQDPSDGVLDRDDTGEPNGILRETAIDLVSTRLDASEAVTDSSLLRALTGLAAMGITSIGAILGLGDGPWASLGDEVTRLVAVADRLPITVHAFVIAHTGDGLVDAARRIGWSERLRWAGYKGFADGSLGGHTAAMHAPFSDRPDQTGTMRLDASDRELARASLAMGGMVAIHAIGDRANGAVIDLFEELVAEGANPRKLRIEHASVLERSDIDRIARLGVIASVQPAFLGSEFEWIADRVGADRVVSTYPFASLDNAGVPMGGGSDSPVESPDPWAGMALARDRAGVMLAEGLLPDRALALFTDGAAVALGEPLPLAPTSPADVIIVDRDPVTIDPDDLRETVVYETWVRGARVDIG